MVSIQKLYYFVHIFTIHSYPKILKATLASLNSSFHEPQTS